MRQVEMPDDRTLTYEYDDNGRVTRTLDDAGRDTLTEYDALGRVVRRFGPVHDAIDADDPLTILSNVRRVTAFERDTLGNVTGIRAGHANATGLIQQLRLIASYTYDDFGNVLTETDALAKTTHYVYDRHHNLIETRYPNGDTIAVVLDHSRNGLITSRSVADASSASAPEQTRYFYNDLGQALRIEHPHVDYNYTYDRHNRVHTVTDHRQGIRLTYDYTPAGKLNSVRDSTGKQASYLYDDAGRLAGLVAPNGDKATLTLDPGGRLQALDLSSGVKAPARVKVVVA